MACVLCIFFFFQAEDGIRDLVRSRGLGDVYKRQVFFPAFSRLQGERERLRRAYLQSTEFICLIVFPLHVLLIGLADPLVPWLFGCLLYTSDAADERSSVDLGGRRIIKPKTTSIQ